MAFLLTSPARSYRHISFGDVPFVRAANANRRPISSVRAARDPALAQPTA
jgi:hypothetical protein